MNLARLSLNQRTVPSWTLPQAIDGCVRAGLGAIGVWREPLADCGVDEARRRLVDAGLRVSSLCRGGFLTAVEPAARQQAITDNLRAMDEAAAIAAECLVLVVGGLPDGSRDLTGARERVAEGLAWLAPEAADRGVRLALEPMHPIFTADRGVIATLGEALDLAEQFPADQVGVVVDSFHVWWDPELTYQLSRAAPRIVGCQISDWITPLPPDALLSRGMIGDGHIDLAGFLAGVHAQGYAGDIEVEIFNAEIWAADPAGVLTTIVARYDALGDSI